MSPHLKHIKPTHDNDEDFNGNDDVDANQVNIIDEENLINAIMDDVSSIMSMANNSLSGAAGGSNRVNVNNIVSVSDSDSGNVSGNNIVSGAQRPTSFCADNEASSPCAVGKQVQQQKQVMNQNVQSSSGSCSCSSCGSNKKNKGTKRNMASASDRLSSSSSSPRGNEHVKSSSAAAAATFPSFPSSPRIYHTPRTTMRIRVTNEQSKRSKDVMVDISTTASLFRTVYDHPGVKEAHVRKWSPTIVQKVRRQQAEIKCAVCCCFCCGGPVVGVPARVFTIAELKETTTRQLYDLLDGKRKSKSSFVTAGFANAGGGKRDPRHYYQQAVGFVHFILQCVEVSDNDNGNATSTTMENSGVFAKTTAATANGTCNSTFRCPVSGVEFSYEMMKQFKDRIRASQPGDGDQDDDDDDDEHSSPSKTKSMDHIPSVKIPFPQQVEQQHPFHVSRLSEPSLDMLSVMEDDQDHDPLTRNTTGHLQRQWQQQQQQQQLIASPNSSVRHVGAPFGGIFEDTLMSVGSSSVHDHLSLPNHRQKEHLRIRVSNRTSHRFKDLVVRIGDNLNLFDAVYNHPGVKEAHVRKWGPQIVQDVKNGLAEIQIVVWDDDAARPWRTFRVQDLSGTSTRDLYETVPESSDLVKLFLECVKIKSVPNTSINNTNNSPSLPLRTEPTINTTTLGLDHDNAQSTKLTSTFTTASTATVTTLKGGEHISTASVCSTMRLKNGMPHSSTPDLNRIRQSRSVESSLGYIRNAALSNASKRRTRPNHMIFPGSGAFEESLEGSPSTTEGVNRRWSISDGCVNYPSSRSMNRPTVPVTTPANTTVTMPTKFNDDSSTRKSRRGNSRGSRCDSRLSKIDLDALLMQSNLRSKHATERRQPSLSSQDVFQTSSGNAAWKETANASLAPSGKTETQQVYNEQLPFKMQRFLKTSQSSTPIRSTSDSTEGKNQKSSEEPLTDFQRLCNSKRSASLQCIMSGSVRALPSNRQPDSQNVTFPSIIRTQPEKENPFLSRVSSLTLQGGRPVACTTSTRGAPNATFSPMPMPTSSAFAITSARIMNNNDINDMANRMTLVNAPKVSDRISRFLRVSQSATTASAFSENSKGPHASASTLSHQTGSTQSQDPLKEVHRYTAPVIPKTLSNDFTPLSNADIPPITEIEVIKSEDSPDAALSPGHNFNNKGGGICLSPKLVQEIFPYHVVLDDNFRILQVGNSLPQLLDVDSIIGRTVSDFLKITSPIPMNGKWDWSIFDKLRENTVFLESVQSDSVETKVKIKGTIIEISSSPRTVMMALLPNVKNFSDLESMDLSMADLPLHSCQREAVLLGEHSKSEVKLTNHLDQLHRDLINSMEKAIEERTDELATANRDLERANSQLAIQSARQLEHFACMSHEIRTPLNCIVGMSSLLLDDADEMNPMHADSIRMINTSGDLLKAVVDDVLDYAKLESGSFEVDIKPTNLQETLGSVVHSISQKVQEKNIRLRTHFSPTLPLILETDSRRLQQVLFNLLGNAGKFSDNNSVIDLRVALMTGPLQQEEGQPVMFSASGQIIRFAVIDYGKGIDKKDFKTIFEPFSQASKETQNVYGGTGLGLSITSKLVHRLGGTVGLDSEPGMYTAFIVDLPFAGTPVEVNNVRKKLLGTDLFLVEPPKSYDYSFTRHEILQEPIPFDRDVVEIYGLNVVRCNSLPHAFSEANINQKKKRHVALLIHESLYDESAATLENLLQSPDHTVITFGPTYSIPQTRDRHLKSLHSVFPATLLDTIVTHVISQRQVWANEHVTSESKESVEASMTNSKAEMQGGLLASLYKSEEGLSASLNASSSNPLAEGPATVSKSINNDSAPGGLLESLSTSSNHETRRKGGLFALLSSNSDKSLQDNAADVNFQESNATRGVGLFASLSRPPGPPEDVSPFRRKSSASPPSGGLFASLKGDNDRGREKVARSKSASSKAPLLDNGSSSPFLRTSQRKVAAPQRDLKVLYAEDNAINQKILSKMLTRTGIHNNDITIVDNGQKAVDICEKVEFDIIFMDMQMPVMDGMEATRRIVERDPNAIVYFVSAHALDEYRSQAEAVGARGFFSKPVQINQIVECLNNLGKAGTRLEVSNPNTPPAAFTAAVALDAQETAASATPTTGAISQNTKGVRGFKVLYAEDNKVNQKVLSRVLNRAGVTDITIVDNGKAAVDLCLKEKFDCIFMDMLMPIMDGREATKLIVENDPQATVAIVTAYTEEEVEEKPTGAWTFIPKTFRLAQIEEFLKRLEKRLEERDPNWNRPPLVPQAEQSKQAEVKWIASVPPKEKPQIVNRDLKVLYAEDNVINQKVLSRILNRAGVSDITIVDNGKKAVDICQTVKFDFIFMDMQMPVMDGVEACRLIVENDPTARVVYVTAHALDEFKAQAVASGGSGWISKPFRLSDVQKLVEDFNL